MSKSGSSDPVRILLLEDDFTLSSIIEEFLSAQGYEVTAVYDGEAAIDAGYEKGFDLFLLDVKVPYCNGFDVLRELRNSNRLSPAMFITSLGSIDDLSQAYDAGCDDYLKKPFELKELELRVKALIKRSAPVSADRPIIVREGVVFYPSDSRLVTPETDSVLPRKEAKILKQLLSNPERLFSARELIESAWDYEEDASEENLRTHIKNLRKQLGKEAIVNIRGQGYRIALS
jgi:OmpR-family two-component system manganese-sensing response regulator